MKRNEIPDVSIMRKYSDVFRDDFPGTLRDRQVKFKFSIIPEVPMVAQSPYLRNTSEM